jgi:Zn-dependent protease with chaperone function
MKLMLVIIEGQLYLAGVLAIFVAELAFLFWGLWSRRPIIGLVAVIVMVPLIRSTVSAIRACYFRIRAPEGMPLGRSEGRALYDFVEEIRRAVDAPPVDSITITGGFHASAVVYSPPWRLRRCRTLVLGLPVLTTLSKPELRAVIAHELAHFSRAYDPFAAWVYRTHRGWFALRASLDRRLATPLYVYWLIRWYVPRLNAASAEVARRHELVADRVAAKVGGSRAAADALVAFESGARFADDTHWPKIQISHETATEPPRPYSQMLTWNARITSTDALDALFAGEAEPDDTHPSLRERFARLEEAVRKPPPDVCSAGEEILGVELEKLAGRLDHGWITRNGESWTQHRAEYLERRATLERLSAIETPTADELFKRAEVLEILEGSDEALPIYQRAAEQGHPAANLAAGRVLLGRMDSKGIALVEASMDRDDSLVPEGCRILAEYYTETNQELAARKCEWRATRHTTRVRLAQHEQTH